MYSASVTVVLGAISVGLIHREHDLATVAAGVGRERNLQPIELAGRSEARLIETQSVVNKRIVDDDLFGFNFLAVLDDRQLRPPALGRAVGIIFLVRRRCT